MRELTVFALLVAAASCDRVGGKVSIERCPEAGPPKVAAAELTRVMPLCGIFDGRLLAFLAMSTTETNHDVTGPARDVVYKIICSEKGECHGVSVHMPGTDDARGRPNAFSASDTTNMGTGRLTRAAGKFVVSLEERLTGLGTNVFTIDLDTGSVTFTGRTPRGVLESQGSGSCSSGLVKPGPL